MPPTPTLRLDFEMTPVYCTAGVKPEVNYTSLNFGSGKLNLLTSASDG